MARLAGGNPFVVPKIGQSMRRDRLVLYSLLFAGACQGPTSGGGSQIGGAVPHAEARSGTAAGTAALAGELALAGGSVKPLLTEPLRDPREQRLRHVRQLTMDKVVASPRFSADGRSIYFLSRRTDSVALERISASGGPAESMAVGPVVGTPWRLERGRNRICAAVPSRCDSAGWPELDPSRGCSFTSIAVGIAGCPSSTPAALPCAEGPGGESACPVAAGPQGKGIQLALAGHSPPGSVEMLGGADTMARDPTFSRDGSTLVWISARSEGPWRLEKAPVGAKAQGEPESFGPEAAAIADPTFAPDHHTLVFASTADDALGHELDLDVLDVLDGGFERVTFTPGKDRFPDFSPDGRLITWVSERNADLGKSDLFVAEWVHPD